MLGYMKINLRYYLRARKFRRKWNRAEIAWMLEHVKRGEVCFDIGAHKGGWTYWMQKAVGSDGQVHAFEPQPQLNAYLGQLFARRAYCNVLLDNRALVDREGSAELFIPAPDGASSPEASLVRPATCALRPTQVAVVGTTTLDAYIDEVGIGRMDFVKVDVEGAEHQLLAGAQQVLSELRPTWVIESEARHTGEEGVLSLFHTMDTAGYRGYFFRGERLTPLAEFSFQRDQNQEGERFWDRAAYSNNFLFIPD